MVEGEGHSASAASFRACLRSTCAAKALRLPRCLPTMGKCLLNRYLATPRRPRFTPISRSDERGNAHYCTFAACHCRRRSLILGV